MLIPLENFRKASSRLWCSSRTIGQEATAEDLARLEELLDQRARRAREEGVSQKSVEEIFREGPPDEERAS